MWNKKRQRIGWYFIAPWIIGFIFFTAFPLIYAIYISLTEWSIVGTPDFIGLKNFQKILVDDTFWNSVKVSLTYAIVSVPLGILSSFSIAYFLTLKIKGVKQFTIIYYMPAIISGVAVAVVWLWILNPDFGLINSFLSLIGIDGPNWLGDSSWVMPSYWLMAIWAAGGAILTYIVGIKDIPKELYESAQIDGSGSVRQIFKITVPMLSPILFYNLIIGIIASMKMFANAYIIGGVDGSADFLLVNIYRNGFTYFEMGYATAMAWYLFLIIMIFTLLGFLSRKFWVHEN